MTLIKSLLLGSAAGIVAIASAQAADLPTKKGAPAAEYVKVCSVTVNGTPIVGFILPGSDTCLKISGYLSAQYTYGPARVATQNALGLFARGQVNFDAASNTAMGPLLAHVELQMDYGQGFDSRYGGYRNGAARSQLNNGYIQWAGLTAGKHGSYFDFLAGGAAWDDFISPDHTGAPQPLIAYTAAFGGGFLATLSLETPEGAPLATNGNGVRAPDIVGQLAVSQGWGGAQLSAVAHDSRATTGVILGRPGASPILGGLKFNIPGMAGADLKLQGVYAHDALGYSGLVRGATTTTPPRWPSRLLGEGGSPMGVNDYILAPRALSRTRRLVGSPASSTSRSARRSRSRPRLLMARSPTATARLRRPLSSAAACSNGPRSRTSSSISTCST